MNKKSFFLLLAFVMSLLSGCGGSRSTEENVNIRILNKSNREISLVALGSGAQNGATDTTRYAGGFDADGYSIYQQIEPVLANYDFAEIRFRSGESRVLARRLYPENYLGIPELEPGHYYTFEFDFVDNTAIFRMVEDAPPR